MYSGRMCRFAPFLTNKNKLVQATQGYIVQLGPKPKAQSRTVGGQDLVCVLYLVQATRPHSFDPPPLQIFLTQNFVAPKTILDPNI